MKSELIVDVTPQEIAIALTENDRLMEVNREKRKLKVMVKVFGRKTPLELDNSQVERE